MNTFIFLNLEPFKFKFCSCTTVIGCTCEKKQQPGKQLDFQSFSSEVIAQQLTMVDAVSTLWGQSFSIRGVKKVFRKILATYLNESSFSRITSNVRDGNAVI